MKVGNTTNAFTSNSLGRGSSLFSRRKILQSLMLGMVAIHDKGILFADQVETPNRQLSDRAKGLLIGTLLGDALGGPIEFQDPVKVQLLANPPKKWLANEVLDQAARDAAAQRIQLRTYRELRPTPEPYGQWSKNAAAGTVTDDSRHKMVLLEALRKADQANSWPMTDQDLARTYLAWSRKWDEESHADYREISEEWLQEYGFSARWLLGERDPSKALPLERMWVGLPTCCGQMGLLPLAIIYAGQPEAAYLAAYHLAFFDNSWGRDLNAALVAGLAQALVLDAEGKSPRDLWNSIIDGMRNTDPYRYSQVPWSQRPLERWLKFGLDTAKDAQHRPAQCFARLDEEFSNTTKWEAHVPFVVMFSALELCEYDPLAALQLSMEWGHDTDSYAQLLGAFIGALYGPQLFPTQQTTLVNERLQSDYGEQLEEWVELLVHLNSLSRQRTLIAVS
ncbi:MAG: ADP-ribosylglycohydrolase family protein [Bythopirellula sp.]|nr:ADP-ribosylglycohydrolase family protein [Bythopirellula sp.]